MKPMISAAKPPISWSNPQGFNPNAPFIYLIEVVSAAGNKYRYVGRARDCSRLREYEKNINRALASETSRPPIMKSGERQSDGNVKYRYVHLALVKAIREKWRIKVKAVENCPKENLTAREKFYMDKYIHNLNNVRKLNGGKMWHVEEYAERAAKIQ